MGKEIWRRKYGVSLFILLILLSGCISKNNDPVKVIYELSIDPDRPHKVFVAYRDSTGYITFCTDKSWTKEVNVPLRNLASLLIISHEDIEIDFNDIEYHCSQIKYKHGFSAKITYGENVISEYSDNIISMSVIAGSKK